MAHGGAHEHAARGKMPGGGESAEVLAGLVLPPGVSRDQKGRAYQPIDRATLEQLARELSSTTHLNCRDRPVQLLSAASALSAEELVRRLGTDPVDSKLFPPETVQRMIRLGLLPIIERKLSDGGPSEILIGLLSQSKQDGTLLSAVSISMPICDEFYPALQKRGLKDRVRFVLLSGNDFELLENLRKDEEARRKFLREIDPQKSARTTFMEVLEKAIAWGASDIHIEPLGTKEARIRYRVDGALVEDPTLITPAYAQEFVNVIKVTAELDITEKRRPQDGSISFKKESVARGFLPDNERLKLSSEQVAQRFKFLDGKSLRISTLPTPHGESCAIRILRSAESSQLKLTDLNLPPDVIVKLRTLLGAPNGVLLVAGPTGSGKSTTLAGCLAELNSPEVKIITVEDPVEQEQRGVTQTGIRSDIGYSFADALRSILRHDPDIVLVGEVRDGETAKIMIQGANTGHLMLSTIHTNDSIGVLKRLRDLDVEEFQIQDSLLGVLSQRLVRRLCGSCKEVYDARAELNKLFGDKLFEEPKDEREADSPDAIVMYRPGPRDQVCSCKSCQGRGYRGRIAVPELWVIGQDEKDLISRGEHGHRAYYDAAVKNGMRPMSLQGLDYALQGLTDLSELRAELLKPAELILRRDMFKAFFESRRRSQ